MSADAPASDLTGWVAEPFTAAGITHDVYEKGTGPGVVVIPEIPGITPWLLAFGDHLVEQGFTVAIPSAFGIPGALESPGYLLKTVPKMCVSAEFRAFATNARRPFADYLRGLARDLNSRTPGPGVGVVGMCFTGGFALAAAVDDSVLASVVSQPSVPFAIGRARKADPGMSVEEFDAVAARAADSSLCVLGLRFSKDMVSPAERMATLGARLGSAFELIQLDSSPGNPDGYKKSAHQVITREVRTDPPNLAAGARDRVVAFLQERLTA